jgi:hypothetical protein
MVNIYSLISHVVVERLEFLLCIREVEGSNLGKETGYPEMLG